MVAPFNPLEIVRRLAQLRSQLGGPDVDLHDVASRAVEAVREARLGAAA